MTDLHRSITCRAGVVLADHRAASAVVPRSQTVDVAVASQVGHGLRSGDFVTNDLCHEWLSYQIRTTRRGG